MSKKSNPTVIGAFVVGAVVLFAAAVALFGGSELLAKRETYIAYFTEDTKGLRVGSNVMLNGVRIGQVSGVALIIDEGTFTSKTKVTLEILPESFIVIRDGLQVGEGMESAITHEQLLEEGGLRASLQAESFVTGQLLVELEFRPETDIELWGGLDDVYPEIPTIPSNIQELVAKVRNWFANLNEKFDMDELGQRVENVLQGIDELVNSPDVRESLAGINAIINRQETQGLTATLDATLVDLRSAVADAGELIQNADGKLDTLELDLKPIAEKVITVLDEAKVALKAASIQLQGESAQSYQFAETLREVEGAARSLREFMDYLERNPEAVLRGKRQ